MDGPSNPRLTAIFKEELVRKYGLFFRMLLLAPALYARRVALRLPDLQQHVALHLTYLQQHIVGLISKAPSGVSISPGPQKAKPGFPGFVTLSIHQ